MKRILFFTIANFIFIPLFGQERAASFTEDFIRMNDEKVTVEVNEVQELVHVLMAITDIGLQDSNMINHNSEYYDSVIKHFGPSREHPAVRIADSLLNGSILYYIFLSSNANGFTFNGNKLIRTNIYTFPAKGIGTVEINEDPILKYQNLLEDFAMATDFRGFYVQNKPFYDKIKRDYEKYGEIEKQKEWLERKFDYKINSYRVLTSPLIGGIHATTTFEDNNFKEMLLYLPMIRNDKEPTNALNIAMNSRVIFTEIDHNYVGPVSDKYRNTIDTVFNNRDLWVNSANRSTAHYLNPVKVFDEYMTWGLFILYASDTYVNAQKNLQYIVDHINNKMRAKGFPQSEAFNKELYRLYNENPKNKIETIYKDILDWSSTHH